MFPLPTSVFLTKGIGVHRYQLTAFELALRAADIEQQNLVSISSILPPHCKLITREEGVATLRPGEITFSVLARAEVNEPGRLVAASIGIARPADSGMYGYIAEHHGFGMTADAERRVHRRSRRHHAGDHARHRIRSGRGLERAQEGLRAQPAHRRKPLGDGGGRRRRRRTVDLRGGGGGFQILGHLLLRGSFCVAKR